MMPLIVALGEPLVEFTAAERGPLGTVRRFCRGFGGDTSNVAVAVARLGVSAGYIARVGDDEFGHSFLELWRRERVDASRVVVEPGGFTGIYLVAIDEDGQSSFTYYRAGSAASQLSPADLDMDYLAAARVLHTSGITQAISESAFDTAHVAMDHARAHGVTVSYDANVRPRLRPLAALRPAVETAMGQADIVFLSTEDAEHLYGTDAPREVLRRVRDLGPRLVVLKAGGSGCWLAVDDSAEPVEGWPIAVVDATGAGDAFDAGFLVEWVRGVPYQDAARFANAVGALTAAGLGAVASIPARSRVEEFIRGRSFAGQRSPLDG